jgi:hypothetical protein
MDSKKIKDEIKRAVEDVPEAFLADVLHYLNRVVAASKGNVHDLENLRRILEEDRALLEKLAQ